MYGVLRSKRREKAETKGDYINRVLPEIYLYIIVYSGKGMDVVNYIDWNNRYVVWETLDDDSPAKEEGFRYNAKLMTDGWYSGNGRFCKDTDEIAKFAREYNAPVDMEDIHDCQYFYDLLAHNAVVRGSRSDLEELVGWLRDNDAKAYNGFCYYFDYDGETHSVAEVYKQVTPDEFITVGYKLDEERPTCISLKHEVEERFSND